MPPRAMMGRRPANEVSVETWIRASKSDRHRHGAAGPNRYAVRLSVDVSRELRSRIKIAAFTQGSTVAMLLRQLLQREFGEDSKRP